MEPVPVPSPRPWSIYVLCDPRDADPVRRVRYVGASVDPGKRRLGDIGPKNAWMQELRAAGLVAHQEIVEEGTGDWQAAERRWMEHYRGAGASLFNQRAGGMGDAAQVQTWPPSPDFIPQMVRVRRALDVLLAARDGRGTLETQLREIASNGVAIEARRLVALYYRPHAYRPIAPLDGGEARALGDALAVARGLPASATAAWLLHGEGESVNEVLPPAPALPTPRARRTTVEARRRALPQAEERCPLPAADEPLIRHLLALYAMHGTVSKGRHGNPRSIPGLSRAAGLPESRLNALRGTFRADRKTRRLKPEEAERIAVATVALGLLPAQPEELALALLCDKECAAIKTLLAQRIEAVFRGS